ncbi:GH92 family glycosyl hydrolase [Agriterribacter sp.]|uniref:GH92 family glycosyl hydrolase n=1 Tax=Agriterribacter sp. TaxID=2821509 RepID=UPI002C0AE21E|nr:GH92 family glycosyl hydrolase [Agriterribacter sp.]HRO47346.1 GH92 family glycosyl hydrolase [Agriterribacter sp.]HRQ15759.1 GH92 family glycosyl hydrolase [Agriterribacter sp.]
MTKLFFLCLLTISITGYATAKQKQDTLWRIGVADHSANEFALAPDGFKKFIEYDFGFEDKFFLVGHSREKNDFPYVIPGPADTWGGTWPTSGWRTNQVNILFGVEDMPAKGTYTLIIELSDYAKKFLPLIKISINNQSVKQQLTATGYDLSTQKSPSLNEPYVDTLSITGNVKHATHKTIEIPVESGVIKKGGNCITIEVLQGSWIMFDDIRLEGNRLKIEKPGNCFVRNVKAANYALLQEGKKVQPLLVNVEHLQGLPGLSVELDGRTIFKERLEKGNYEFEAPMPAVETVQQSKYRILADGKLVEEGVVKRSAQKLQTPADYVDTRIGTGHSRWMIAPGPWMPFSMVKLSPDNQNAGWQAGYQPSYESIGTFSHIHEWTMGGLGVFASNGTLKTTIGDELLPGSGYRSAIDKKTEEAPIGYYKVQLKDYDIKAEMTATTRCGLMRFTFPANRDSSRVLVDLHIPSEYDYQLKKISVRKVSDYRIEGFAHQFSPNVWSRDADQDYTVHFVLEFDKPFQSIGGWTNDSVSYGDHFFAKDIKNAGFFLQFDAKANPVVQMRSGISLVSIDNADLNLKTEITTPFGWNFEAVRQHQSHEWNDIFNRVNITTTNRQEKVRFYNSMYRSICSRNTWSDVNGQWRGTDGKVQQLKGADDVALGCDAFWNTFWNLNQMWNLITPEWSNRWVNSQLAMYDAYGRLAKGPAGMNYIPVMVAEHEIPMMVGAYQMGIRNFDASKLLEAAINMQTIPATKIHTGFAGNRDLTEYMKHKYVPSDKGRFSNSMEYSYDDWTVGQLAKSLGETELYKKFNDRGYWWKNAIDEDGYCHMKLSDGKWVPGFDPFRSGANEEYVEGNAWQLTFFVPQDVPALVNLVGKKKFIDRLEWGFEASAPWRYNGMNDQYWNYPVVQGNQQSMHFSFLFNWAGKPWSTQKWTRSILERYYGYGIGNAYLGDEDQGQMSAWFVMAALGLFQTDGGCSNNPIYEIASPLFEKIEIDLGNRFGRGKKFVIEAKGASRRNMYVQSAVLNGKELKSFYFPASELLKGGSLIMQMGATPNKKWGIDNK